VFLPLLHGRFRSSIEIGAESNLCKVPTMTNGLREILVRFDVLPDDAILPSRVTGIILGMSERTIRYHPNLPRVQISRGRYGQRVGDIRKLAREGMSAPGTQ
jgi:hypothetical protein